MSHISANALMAESYQMTENALKFTKKNVEDCNPRLAGSPGCKQCAEIINKELAQVCDSNQIETFDFHSGAFIGFMKVLSVSFLIIVICNFLGGVWLYLATGLYILCWFSGWGEFVLYREYFDRFYPKKIGYNVFGKLEPAQTVTQQIIVGGHHDAALIFNFLEKHCKYYAVRIILGLACLIIFGGLLVIQSILQLFGQPPPFYASYLSYFLIASLVFTIPFYFFVGNEVCPGAGDNLIACAIVLELAKFFRRQKLQGKQLQHTRIIFGSFDAEEEGLRGARAYVNAHKDELLKIPTFFINIDSVYHLKDLKCFTRELNGFRKSSKKLAKDCSQTAKKLGYSMPAVPITFGGGSTDGAEFARIGVEATCLLALPVEFIRDNLDYHSSRDTVDKIEPESVNALLKIIGIHILDKDENSI
jgi:hypothetical protein